MLDPPALPSASDQAPPDSWCPLWALAALLLVLAIPWFRGQVYSGDDLSAFHLPVRYLYAQALAQGDSIHWTPDLFGGFFLSGEGQAGALHPGHWLLYRFLPLRAAFNFEVYASYPFLALGMFLWLRWRLPRGGAWLGALLFTFCGFNLLHFVHLNAIAIVAHIPWLLWLIDAALRGTCRWRGLALCGVALLTGSQLLLGYPQYVWFSLLAEGGWVLFALLERSAGSVPAPRWMGWIVAKGVGAALGAIQLLTTMDALAISRRSDTGAEFANTGALNPANVIQWFAPYLFRTRVLGGNTHELGLYLGAVPLLLIVWLWSRRERWGAYRPLILAATFMAVVAFWLALGNEGLLYRLQTMLPLVNKFRWPPRTLVLLYLAVAPLAAVGWLLLRSEAWEGAKAPWRALRGVWLAPVASVVITALLVVAHALLRRRAIQTDIPPQGLAQLPLNAFWLWWVGPLLLTAAAALITAAARGARWAPSLLVILAAVDLGTYGCSYQVFPAAREYVEHSPTEVGLPIHPGRKTRVGLQLRDPDNPVTTGLDVLRYDIALIDGYAGLEPQNRLDYRTVPALRAAAVDYVYRDAAFERIPGLIPTNDRRWFAVPAPAKYFRLASSIHYAEDAQAALAALPADELPATAILEAGRLGALRNSDDAGGSSAAATDDALTVVVHRPGHIELTAETLSIRFLVTAERFHPGWRLTIDGRPADSLPVNGDFLGALIVPGKHSLRWRFEPDSLVRGRAITWGAWGFWLVAVLGSSLWARLRRDTCL